MPDRATRQSDTDVSRIHVISARGHLHVLGSIANRGTAAESPGFPEQQRWRAPCFARRWPAYSAANRRRLSTPRAIGSHRLRDDEPHSGLHSRSDTPSCRCSLRFAARAGAAAPSRCSRRPAARADHRVGRGRIRTNSPIPRLRRDSSCAPTMRRYVVPAPAHPPVVRHALHAPVAPAMRRRKAAARRLLDHTRVGCAKGCAHPGAAA